MRITAKLTTNVSDQEPEWSVQRRQRQQYPKNRTILLRRSELTNATRRLRWRRHCLCDSPARRWMSARPKRISEGLIAWRSPHSFTWPTEDAPGLRRPTPSRRCRRSSRSLIDFSSARWNVRPHRRGFKPSEYSRGDCVRARGWGLSIWNRPAPLAAAAASRVSFCCSSHRLERLA